MKLELGRHGKAFAGLLLALLVAGSAQGQSLKEGMWTGTIEPPDGSFVEITYHVRVESDTLRLKIIAAEFGEFEASDVRLEDGVLHFNWYPGQKLTCELKPRDEGRFRGVCLPDDGDPGYLTMEPPKDGR